MSFAKETGRTTIRKCIRCGLSVEHKEILVLERPQYRRWSALQHRAPCGAWCSSGVGYDSDEMDLHTPPFGKCPRCGESDTEIVHIIEKADKIERVVFYRYLPPFLKHIGFSIELETMQSGEWKVKHRWGTNFPDSLEKTIKWAEIYVPWLKS